MDLELPPHCNHSLPAHQSYLLKRQIRIKSSRLPPDFFIASPASRYEAAACYLRESHKDYTSRDVRTPSFEFRKGVTISQEKDVDFQRKVETARASLQKKGKQNERLRESLGQTRRNLKVYRRPSLNNKTIDIDISLNRHIRLPKLLSKTPKQKHNNSSND